MPKLKFLLNENIGSKVANFLREQDYDIKSTIEDFPGIDDKELLKIAFGQRRIIITLDKDFCDLVFHDSLPCQGIILLRLRNESPRNINKVLAVFLRTIRQQNLKDKFVVIRENKVKIRPIKS